jgi:hypothetical protein
MYYINFNFQLFVSGISGHVQILMRMDNGTYQVCVQEMDLLLRLLIMNCISIVSQLWMPVAMAR